MTIDLVAILGSVLQVLLVGLVLGAGLPVLFSLGVRLHAGVDGAAPSRPAVVGGWACYAVCLLAALAGIVVIIFGKQLFGV